MDPEHSRFLTDHPGRSSPDPTQNGARKISPNSLVAAI